MPRPGRGGDLFASMKIKAAVNTDDGVRRSRLGTMRANHQVSSASPAGTIMLRLRIKDIAWRQRGRSILAAVIVNDSFAASNRNGAVRVQISRPGPIPGQILLTILRKLRGPRSKASSAPPKKNNRGSSPEGLLPQRPSRTERNPFFLRLEEIPLAAPAGTDRAAHLAGRRRRPDHIAYRLTSMPRFRPWI